ncbi:hypothetical protein [Paludibacterium yongneupense]|nr:hypothetical protein [Paludibacterium yongneupense]
MHALHEEVMYVALASTHALARKRTLSCDGLSAQTMFWFKRSLNPGF